ncbi:class I SAM-dependent DNA methyltransferase [Frigoriglobus tundricola]|uniref:class I SAM-dependent DNA methyltransferase n=1 Tax=Frigoriglobus tundricola TaxID=2774151 RepID=UPI00148EA3DA|nr:class I SAM-dependent methyltransferase [Frigoriglobus tundricola]
MFRTIGQAWRAWRARSALLAPMWGPSPGQFFAPELHFPELRDVAAAGGPELQPYEGLAGVWDEYASANLPDYPSFLVALARGRRGAMRSVLDLACGTGLLAPRLARVAGDVVGLDASESMLAAARQRVGTRAGCTFERGDFRGFSLGREFDAVVCASNSLNYVADRHELSQVFAAVGKHLRPGGVFVFDTTTELRMRAVSHLYFHAQAGNRRFAIRYEYDAAQQKQTARVILPAGVETHRRIPLGPTEVGAAVEGTGLALDDYFSSAARPRNRRPAAFCFFVVTKRT